MDRETIYNNEKYIQEYLKRVFSPETSVNWVDEFRQFEDKTEGFYKLVDIVIRTYLKLNQEQQIFFKSYRQYLRDFKGMAEINVTQFVNGLKKSFGCDKIPLDLFERSGKAFMDLKRLEIQEITKEINDYFHTRQIEGFRIGRYYFPLTDNPNYQSETEGFFKHIKEIECKR
eukprot:406052_1